MLRESGNKHIMLPFLYKSIVEKEGDIFKLLSLKV